MIGKINYKTGSLTQLKSKSQLPIVGSTAITYYIEDENSFYVYKEDGTYERIKSGSTSWYLNNTSIFLSNRENTKVTVDASKLKNMDGTTTSKPSLGDKVYDKNGASGFITEVNPTGPVVVRTMQANLPRKMEYADKSWELWLTQEEGGGHYYWDSSTNILTYDGPVTDISSPVIWESYSIIGGAQNFVITGGTRVGTRKFLAWDGNTRGVGNIKFYYTKNNSDESYKPENEVATIRDINQILSGESGIYLGNADTLNDLNNGLISAVPAKHTISNNDWVYVIHHDESPITLYKAGLSIKANAIVEYEHLLYKSKQAFTSTTWNADYDKLVEWDGNTYTFVYRAGIGWTKGTLVDTDTIEPDNVKLTTTFANKMTIKDGGVDTAAIANNAIITSKIANNMITTEKIADKQVTRPKLSNELQTLMSHADTMWYSGNFIVSTSQPATPTDGSYIIWVNSNPASI